MTKTHSLALAILLGCAGAAGPNDQADPSCGVRPNDWCPAPAADPCGVHTDEKSCRADYRCRGLPYRGESVVSCEPDGKGFWTNCPAVGCVSRSDPARQPARADVVERLCGSKSFGGEGAEIHVWRTAEDEATVLELRSSHLVSRPATPYYDASGRQLLVVPSKRGRGGSDLDKRFERQRAAVLAGLKEAETVPCGRRR